MSLADELRAYAKKTHDTQWTRRNGQKVPENDDISMGNSAVDLDAVVLYADLKDSTGLVKGFNDTFASEVYKNYLYAVSRIIRAHGGVITAFDGDRVMGVFIGDSKNTKAAKAALKINWTVRKVLQPAILSKYPTTKYRLQQKVGIASSKTMVSRTGIRGSNDLVWIGNAANIAAKLAALHSRYPTYITAGVYNRLSQEAKLGGSSQRNMWTDLGDSDGFGRIYGSSWIWPL